MTAVWVDTMPIVNTQALFPRHKKRKCELTEQDSWGDSGGEHRVAQSRSDDAGRCAAGAFSEGGSIVTNRPFPVAETVLLPAAAACAASGLVVAFVRSLSLISGMAPGPAAYLGLGITALLAAAATTIGSLFNLPLAMRVGDLALSFSVMLVGLRIDGPVAVGRIHWRRTLHVVDVTTIMPLAAVALWLLTGYLTMVIARLYPAEAPKVDDRELERRLLGEWGERSIYTERNAELVGELARRRVYDCMSGLYLILILAAVVRPTLALSNDIVLVGAGCSVAGGLLFYLAVVELASRRRRAEANSETLVLSAYGAVWGVGAFLPALAAIVGGGLLPASISPLAGRDYLNLFNRLTVWFTQNLLRTPSDSPPMEISKPEGIPGMGPLPGGNDIITFIVAISVGVAGYVLYRLAAVLHRSESDRARRLPMLLLALLLWPFHALRRWLQSLAERREAGLESAGKPGKAVLSAKAQRRRFRLLEPTLFVRAVYARMLRLAANAGVERHRAETARELQARLTQIAPDAGVSVEELTHVYCDARYAGRLPEQTWKRRAISLLRHVAEVLQHRTG